MKILHLASADLWGGAEAQLSILARASKKLGLTLHVALLNRGSRLGEQLRRADIEVYELDESQMSTASIVMRLYAYCRRVRPDVIHTHRFKENIIGGAIGWALRRPSVRTVHGAPEPELLRATARRRVLSALDHWSARHLQEAAVAVSDELAVRLRASQPGVRLSVIPNGVDAADLAGQARDGALPACEQPTLRVGFFGRLVPIKRVDLLLQAAALSTSNRRRIELYVVGEGPQAHEMQSLAARLGISDRVHFVGFQADAAAWISSMDCVVLTSDHEGLPMIVLEALALGVPVIARAVGGIPEILHGVEHSVLIESAEPTDIAAVLSQFASRELPAARHSLLPPRYSAEMMARSYLSLYRQMRPQAPMPANAAIDTTGGIP